MTEERKRGKNQLFWVNFTSILEKFRTFRTQVTKFKEQCLKQSLLKPFTDVI